MNMDKEKNIAQFRFLHYKISETVVKINADSEPGKKLDVQFQQKAGVNEEASRMRFEFVVSVNDAENILDIKVTTVAFFEYDSSLTEEQKRTFFMHNAPAILFPYVRAYISTLTAQAGINTIVLPTINFSKK